MEASLRASRHLLYHLSRGKQNKHINEAALFFLLSHLIAVSALGVQLFFFFLGGGGSLQSTPRKGLRCALRTFFLYIYLSCLHL
jgi:hypothetical protein